MGEQVSCGTEVVFENDKLESEEGDKKVEDE